VDLAYPACIIAHVSRCGSTLLTNALREIGNCVALSEPSIVTDIFEPSHCLADQPVLRRLFSHSVINIYSAYRGYRAAVVVKLASWNTCVLHQIRAVWPSVPFVLLIRNPLEIIVSQLSPGGWLDLRAQSPGIMSLLNLNTSTLDNVHFCACLLRTLYSAMLHAIDDKCFILDYSMLNINTVAQIASIAGLESTSGALESVDHTFRRYSKDVDGTKAFSDDVSSKLRTASRLIDAATIEYVMAPYVQLLNAAKSNHMMRPTNCVSARSNM